MWIAFLTILALIVGVMVPLIVAMVADPEGKKLLASWYATFTARIGSVIDFAMHALSFR